MTCRVVRLAADQAARHRLTVLTAACGWTCRLTQGVAWPRDPGRQHWLNHTCRPIHPQGHNMHVRIRP